MGRWGGTGRPLRWDAREQSEQTEQGNGGRHGKEKVIERRGGGCGLRRKKCENIEKGQEVCSCDRRRGREEAVQMKKKSRWRKRDK